MSTQPVSSPIETLRDALYRGDWQLALLYADHKDPVVREYVDVVHSISPTIRIFWMRWCRDSDRAAAVLQPLAGEVLGTSCGHSAEMRRQWLIIDWLVREWAPIWLSLRDDLVEHVAHLRQLGPVGPDREAEVEGYARKVRDLVWRTSRGMVRGSQGRQARELAYAAVQHAGLYAAWDAVFGPARGYLATPLERAAHLGTPIMNAARDVAWDASLNVAKTTAMACVGAGGLEAVPMAGTIGRLQASAVGLIQRLCAVG